MCPMAVIPDDIDWNGSSELHRYMVVDAFTPRPLEGNQLGVFLDGGSFTPEDMQSLARELKFAETVFLLPPNEGGDVSMRIFTPATELPFAGHPVLGTSFVVGEALGAETVTLETGAGPIRITLERDGGRITFGRMTQPIPSWEPFQREAELLGALSVPSSELPVEVYRNGPAHVYVKLPSEEAVAAVNPDMRALSELDVCANTFAGSERSWKTRMFYPAGGVPEDPATGSAAGPLAVHLARHGEIPFGEVIEIRQGVEIARPSVLYASASGGPDRIESVEVGGSAVIVAQGEYRIR
jgi:trans-2,3-dihydro-3-hydroxyanthranilate isomerase